MSAPNAKTRRVAQQALQGAGELGLVPDARVARDLRGAGLIVWIGDAWALTAMGRQALAALVPVSPSAGRA